MLNPPAGIHIQPLSARIGAEIHGLTLSDQLNPSLQAFLFSALLRYKVLFFRRQFHLSDTDLQSLLPLLGQRGFSHPVQAAKSGDVIEIDSNIAHQSAHWHSDVAFANVLPKISIVQGVSMPSQGGEGLWLNTQCSYVDWPTRVQQWAAGLKGIHRREATNQHAAFETIHPLLHRHPETGEVHLLLGQFLQGLLGLGRAESQSLIAMLNDTLLVPDNIVSWQWQNDDVVIYDNRATAHRTLHNYGDARRFLRWLPIDHFTPQALQTTGSVKFEQALVL